MLSKLQFLVEGFFEDSAGAFKKAGLTPNLVTVLGFILAIFTAFLYSTGLHLAALWPLVIVSLLLSGYFDALDGAMARRFLQVSKTGGILDSVLDRLGEIFVYSGLALGGLIDFRVAIWALSASLMVSYVRARAEVEGVRMKGIGIAERPERLLILLLATILGPLVSGALAWGVGLIAILASFTVVERMYSVSRKLSSKPVVT